MCDNSSTTLPCLKRLDWLETLGFLQGREPFSSECTRADDDDILDDSEAFVPPEGYEEIRGTLRNPGPRFIFGHTGSGKSSLRRGIQQELDATLHGLYGPKILAVDYIEHDDCDNTADLSAHCYRISKLILDKARRLDADIDPVIPDNVTGVKLLKSVVGRCCNSVKIDAIYVLVDNFDIQSDDDVSRCYKRIEKLACDSSTLGIDKLILKFFFPPEFKTIRHNLPFDRFTKWEIPPWTKSQLTRILRQRLYACTGHNNHIEIDRDVPLFRKLCEPGVGDIIENDLVRFGLEFNQPRAMLLLANYLLTEHFSSTGSCRRSDDLINTTQTFKSAYNKCIEAIAPNYRDMLNKDAMKAEINPITYIEIRNRLLDNDAFQNSRDMRNVFADPRIADWLPTLPESDSVVGRVESVIQHLCKRFNQQHENGLVLLLQVLYDRGPKDLDGQRLNVLASQLEAELKQANQKSELSKELTEKIMPQTPRPIVLRYLHISDLHLEGPHEKEVPSTTTPNQFFQDIVTTSLLEAIETSVKTLKVKRPFDFIVITGDLARSGKEQDYQVARNFCNQLLENTRLPNRNLFIVPGNHDVDRSVIETAEFNWWYKFESQRDIVSALTSRYAFPALIQKLTNFNTFANQVMGRELFDDKKYYYVDTLSIRKQGKSFRINFVGLNSALFAGYDGDDQQHLALGEVQVEAALRELNKNASLSFAFFHHPFKCFHSTDHTSQNRLMQKVDLILHGHLHEPSNTFVHDAAGKAVIIGAGASYESRESENSFNIVEIDLSTRHGEVQFYKYLKNYNRWTKNMDINPDDPDGKFPFQI